jgi:hypothetical protein
LGLPERCRIQGVRPFLAHFHNHECFEALEIREEVFRTFDDIGGIHVSFVFSIIMKTRGSQRKLRKTRRVTKPRKHKKMKGGMHVENNKKMSDNGIFFIDRNGIEETFLYIRTDVAHEKEEQNDNGPGFIVISQAEHNETVSQIVLLRDIDDAGVLIGDNEYTHTHLETLVRKMTLKTIV